MQVPFSDWIVFLANLSAHMKSRNISEPRVCGHMIAFTLLVGRLPLLAALEAVLMASDSHAIQPVELTLEWAPWTDCVCRKKNKNLPVQILEMFLQDTFQENAGL